MRVTIGYLENRVRALNNALGSEYTVGAWTPSVGASTQYQLIDGKGNTVGSGSYTARELDAMIDGLMSTRYYKGKG